MRTNVSDGMADNKRGLWDGRFGEVFCSVMLRELRGVIVEYLPDALKIGNTNLTHVSVQTVRHSDDSNVLCSAFGQLKIGQLYRPEWRVVLEWPSDSLPTVRLSTCGIANQELQMWHYIPYTYYKIGNRGNRWYSHEPYSSHFANKWRWKNETKLIFDVRCDLERGQVFMTINGCVLPKAVFTNIPNLASLYPFIELDTPHSTATLGPYGGAQNSPMT